MQTTGELWIKYGMIFSKIEVVHFCNSFLVGASQKTVFLVGPDRIFTDGWLENFFIQTTDELSIKYNIRIL
jgi:hypothetical protein